MKRYGYLIQEIIERDNLEASFDEVTCDLPKWSKEYYESQKEDIIKKLAECIGDGSFRITRFEEFEVEDGPKKRKVQSPPVVERIGCNAIMRVVESRVYPKAEIRRHIKDPILLPMLDNFIELMDHGLSIGLRSSQCYGNILLSALDHMLKEKYHVRYYYRYCDDIVVLHGDKRMLWKIRDKIHDKTSEIGLTIKPDEAVRPLSEGLDFLGFVYDGHRARVRKRTKHKFAKKMHEVKSRKRRVQLIGSFYGMAKWGDCRHLMKTILNKKIDMEEFKNLGLVYQPEDGKKRFDGKKYSLGQLVNLHIVILDFEMDVQTENGLRTLVHFQRDNGEKGKYFTSDKVQLQLLRLAKEKGVLPFGTTIGVENFGKGVRYTFN